MPSQHSLVINGNTVSFTPGETLLEVARRHFIDIPTLCHLKSASPTGVCRICLVEVAGASKLAPACATPAAASMVVHTESTRVVEARRMIIRLMLNSGNHNCAVCDLKDRDWTRFQRKVLSEEAGRSELCPAWGDCRLQDLAFKYQVFGTSFGDAPAPYPIEAANPFIIRDFSRCIQCGRCVQACNEIQVNNAIDFGYKGTFTKIVTPGDRPLKDSDCVFCGECLQACPVGALVEKEACPAAEARDTQKVRTTCSYCGVGCQMDLHTRDNRVVRVTGVETAAPNFGSLCVKGRFGFDFINSPERLKDPLVRENGSLRKATWGEALEIVSRKLGAIRETHGGQSLGVLASARITNEDNYLAQKFARAVLKTNNIDHCARLCHASTFAGLAAAFGSGAMTNPIGDIENADVILVTGSNTTETHPVLSRHIKRAVSFKGAKLIVADPRPIKLVDFAHLWLQPNLGTDVAWINAMMQVIIAENRYDQEFVTRRTEGFDELKKAVAPYNPEFVETISGISPQTLREAARMYASAGAGSIVYCMGITQHSTGTDNVKSLANLAMLCGHLGKPGTGVNPLRGQNNVQGACDMGALPNVFSGYQPVSDPQVRQTMAVTWQTDGLPETPGEPVTRMLPSTREGKLKGLYVIGENPMVSDPDLNHAEACLKRLEFLVVQDIFMTETAQLADVVLPAASFAEKDGTFTNTERRVQRVRPALAAPGNARQDWEIICELAGRMGYPMTYAGATEIFAEIAALTPSYRGLSYPRIEERGLPWPCPNSEHPGTPILHQERFTRGLGKFHAVAYRAPAETVDSHYPIFEADAAKQPTAAGNGRPAKTTRSGL